MCPPKYYLIPTVENPWMNTDEQPDIPKAWSQWVAIRNLYEYLGIRVYEIEPIPRLWDMVFTANGAWGKNRNFVIANFRQPIRRAESVYFKKWFERVGYKVWEIPNHIFFEGQGDVVTLSSTYLFGHGPRSFSTAHEYIEKLLGLKGTITPLELVNPAFYHLDTCFMSLRGTKVEGIIYYPGAFSAEGLDILRTLLVDRRFEVSKELADYFVCNSVFVKNVVLLNIPFADYSEKAFELSASGVFMENRNDIRYREIVEREPDFIELIEFMRELGYKIIPVYTSEYMKSGGGVYCCTLFLD